MTEMRNILIVRGPYGSDLSALEGLRDYMRASLQLGVVVVDDSTTLEVMQLPALPEVEVQGDG